MPVSGAGQTLSQYMASLPGVETQRHRFGGTEWVLGRRELGHVHGDALVDIPFTRAVREEVVSAGQAEPHHILPESGWVSVWLRNPESVATAQALLDRSYQIALAQKARAQKQRELQEQEIA